MNYAQILLFESRIEFLKNQFKERGFNTSHDEYAIHREPNKIIDHFATHADPTPSKLYTQWIVNRYHQGNFRQEDVGRINDALTTFHNHKHKLAEKDINKYPTLAELESAVAPHVGAPATEAETKAKVIHDGLKLLHANENGEVYKLLTKEASKEVYGGGAKRGGTGTNWCTAARSDHNMFDGYTSANKGELYTFHIKDDPDSPYQIHLSDNGLGQVMNRKDEPAHISKLLEKFPGLVGNEQLAKKDPIAFGTPEQQRTIFRDLLKTGSSEHFPRLENIVTKAATLEPHDLEAFKDFVDTKMPEYNERNYVHLVKHPKATKDLIASVFKRASEEIGRSTVPYSNSGTLVNSSPSVKHADISDYVVKYLTNYPKGEGRSPPNTRFDSFKLEPRHFEELEKTYPHLRSLLAHQDAPAAMLARHGTPSTEKPWKNNYNHIINALANPRVPSETIERAATDRNLHPYLSVIPHTTPDALRTIYNMNVGEDVKPAKWLAMNLKEHPNTPKDVKKAIEDTFEKAELKRPFRLKPFESAESLTSPYEGKIVKGEDGQNVHYHPHTGQPLIVPVKSYFSRRGESLFNWAPEFLDTHRGLASMESYSEGPHAVRHEKSNRTLSTSIGPSAYLPHILMTGFADPVRRVRATPSDEMINDMVEAHYNKHKNSYAYHGRTEQEIRSGLEQGIRDAFAKHKYLKYVSKETGDVLGERFPVIEPSSGHHTYTLRVKPSSEWAEKHDLHPDTIDVVLKKNGALPANRRFAEVEKLVGKKKPRLIGHRTGSGDKSTTYTITTTPEDASLAHEDYLKKQNPEMSFTRTSPTSFHAVDVKASGYDGSRKMHTSNIVGDVLVHTMHSIPPSKDVQLPSYSDYKPYTHIIEDVAAPTNSVSGVAGMGVTTPLDNRPDAPNQSEPGVRRDSVNKYRKANVLLTKRTFKRWSE